MNRDAHHSRVDYERQDIGWKAPVIGGIALLLSLGLILWLVRAVYGTRSIEHAVPEEYQERYAIRYGQEYETEIREIRRQLARRYEANLRAEPRWISGDSKEALQIPVEEAMDVIVQAGLPDWPQEDADVSHPGKEVVMQQFERQWEATKEP